MVILSQTSGVDNMDRIKACFDKQLNIHITDRVCDAIHHMVLRWELQFPRALNTPLLGVDKAVFTPTDTNDLYVILGLTKNHMTQVVKSISSTNQNLAPINPNHNVASDPTNLLIAWCMHLAIEQVSNMKKRHQVLVDLAKWMHYKFFTSLVQRRAQYAVDQGIMEYTIESLSNKSDIRTYKTWAKFIQARAEDMVSPVSKRYSRLVDADDDVQFLRVITDTQSRLRQAVQLIFDAFYKFHEKGIGIKSTGSTGTNGEGEKILIQKASTEAAMFAGMESSIVRVATFVDPILCQKVASQFRAITPDMLKFAMIALVSNAATQTQNQTFDSVEKVKGHPGLINITGVRALVREILVTSYDHCRKTGVDATNPAQIWNAIKNRYSASRISDTSVINTKYSVEQFIDTLGSTRDPARKASLCIAVIMYIVAKSFTYIR